MKRRAALSVVVVTAVMSGGAVVASAPRAVAAPLISPATAAAGPARVGVPFAVALAVTAGASWSVVSGELPPGLTLRNGQITGVPTQAGAYTFSVQASSGGAATTATNTIFVRPQASAGYDSRVNQVLVARDVFPPPGACNHTGYLTYGIAGLWLDRDTVDANNKLASVKITQIGGDPKSCHRSIDQSRNNLALGYLIRPYMLYNATSSFFPGRLTTAAANNLVAQMWAFARPYSKVSEASDVWSIYDSENHDAQAESFYLLAAQIFRHRPGYQGLRYGDHSTVEQQYQAWHDHWSKYFDERAKRGLFIEAGAPTYHGYTLQAILNIYNFAEDPVLRKKAEMTLDLDFADYGQLALHNVWGGPKSRSYPADSYDGANDSMTNLGNLLFGPSATIGGDNHVLMLATSGYYPPPVVVSLATDKAHLGSFVDISRRPGVGVTFPDPGHNWSVTPGRSVLEYAYATPNYILGTTELWPNDFHVAPSSQNRWQGITFDTGSGNRIYPQAAQSSVSPCNDAFLSIQDKNALVTQKRVIGKMITQKCVNKPTLVYFPATLDSIVEQHGWIFVQEGGTYVAIRPAVGTYQWLTHDKNKAPKREQRFVQLTNNASPIIFEAARAQDYGGPAAFRQRVLGRPFDYKNGVLHYTAVNSSRFTFYHDTTKAPKLNDRVIDYSPNKVFSSPFMQSVFGSGQVTVQLGTQRATYDFGNPAHPVKVVL